MYVMVLECLEYLETVYVSKNIGYFHSMSSLRCKVFKETQRGTISSRGEVVLKFGNC